jgi:RimJ/RimL family protein N-acetyltransferase
MGTGELHLSALTAMQLVRPSPTHLRGYVAALKRDWSPDTSRGAEAAREMLEKVRADPVSLFAVTDDPEGLGPPWKAPDGTLRARIPGLVRWMWEDEAEDTGDGAGAGGVGGFAGSINLRWMKGNAALPSHVLGHIGYAVVPWKRRRSHATKALALMLPLARAQGMPFVEITTDIDNLPSQRVITANGGMLVEEFIKEAMWGGQAGLRFRIALHD